MPEPTRRNFGIRLPVELITAIEARATATGQTKTETVEAILRDALGMEVGNDAPDVGQRLTNVEQRLADVERRLTERPTATPPPPSPTVATDRTATGQGSTSARGKAAPSGTKGKPEGAYTVADALIAAGVCNESWPSERTITEAQVRNHKNRDRTLDRVAGMKGGPLLKTRGWVKDGNWWYPPD